MRRHANYEHLMFTDNERPTSFKLNQILDMVEETRLAKGPYSISLYQQNPTSFTVELHEDISQVGGCKYLGILYYTYRNFTVYYETRETTSGDYGCWQDVTFVETAGRWLATLNSGDNIYNNEIDVSAIDTDGLYCVADIASGWNGK